MIPVSPPITLYTGADGKPLENGSIYIGQAGQDPATNPVSVFWDAAGTIPAAQPLRTVGGYIVNGSTPANVFVAGNHSIAVKDKNGVQVLLDLNRLANPQGFLTAITSGQVTGALAYTPANIAGQDYQGAHRFYSGPASFSSMGDQTLHVLAESGAYSAQMQYERPGAYAIKFGLNENNVMALGGFSQGTNVLRVYWDVSGNQVTLGNVTAYSDMRFKEEIEPIGNAVARTLKMQGFRYLDNRDGQYKIGTGAQQAQQAGFGEAVVTDDNGHLSLAYGQLALALLIETTRELHNRIAALESQINEQKG